MTTSTFFITGLTCDHCVNAIKEEVGEIAGVTKIDIASEIEEASESYAIVD